MTRPPEELIALANKVVANSVVAQALGRLILQIVEVCAEHEISTVATTRAQAFAEAIQAVDWSLCDEAEDQDLFMAHREFFADAIRARAAGEK